MTLDPGSANLKDELRPRYAELIYSFCFSPEREMLQVLIDKSQEHVEGVVRLKLYKGSVRLVGRRSPRSLVRARGRTRRPRATAASVLSSPLSNASG